MSEGRPYQLVAVQAIRAHAAAHGSGAILQMATGSGKTWVFCNLLAGAHAKSKTAIMVVRGKSLVHQASERLSREGVPHGILQGSNTRDDSANILVCSIDTLYARKLAPRADLIVIDECHMAHSDGYKWFFEQYPDTFKLGVSATPHHKLGFRHFADKLIYPTSFVDLVRDKFLVGARYFMPYVPNLKGIKTTAGDFNGKELSDRSSADDELTANAAKIWDKYLRGQSTLCYAVSVRHANILAASLANAGARTFTITANTPDAQRRLLIGGLERGEIDVLVSVGVLTTGIDIPSLRAILCCRPTKSYNLWVQILGRGTRPFPQKDYFTCYDLSGNIERHGPIEAELVGSLDEEQKPNVRIVTCLACYAVFAPESVVISEGSKCCPSCLCVLPNKTVSPGDPAYKGLDGTDEVREVIVEPWELELPGLIFTAQQKCLRKGWIYHTLRNKYGDETAEKAWHRVKRMKKWPTNSMRTKEHQAPDHVLTPLLLNRS